MAEPEKKPEPELPIGLYVSSVEGHHVTRYGSGIGIGVVIDLSAPGNLRWDTSKVVAIPEAEYALYRREYDAHLAAGELVKREGPAAAPAAEPAPEAESASEREKGRREWASR